MNCSTPTRSHKPCTSADYQDYIILFESLIRITLHGHVKKRWNDGENTKRGSCSLDRTLYFEHKLIFIWFLTNRGLS